MKKLLSLLFCLSLACITKSQTLGVYKMNATCTLTITTITNGSFLNETTTPSGVTTTRIKFRNTSALTQTYTVSRTILFNNPTLNVSCGSFFPYTYFTFGYTAFPPCTNTITSADYTILGPANSSVSPFDNSCANGNPFQFNLEEGSSIGQYLVRYKLQNVNNGNDTLSFIVNYNSALGLNQSPSQLSFASVYPNPAQNNATIEFDLNKAVQITIKIYDQLGSLTYHSPSHSFSQGKQFQTIDLSSYPAGIYFISVTDEENTVLILQKLLKN